MSFILDLTSGSAYGTENEEKDMYVDLLWNYWRKVTQLCGQ